MSYGSGFGNAVKDKMRRGSSIKSNGSKKPSSRRSRSGGKGGPTKKMNGGYR